LLNAAFEGAKKVYDHVAAVSKACKNPVKLSKAGGTLRQD
jgi:hypothetical protein